MRVVLKEGAVREAEVDAVVVEPGDPRPSGRVCIEAFPDAAEPPAQEEAVRTCVRRCLAEARERGAASLALPLIGASAPGVGLQRSGEITLEEIRRPVPEESSLAEVWLVVEGEPALRVLEQVQDAEKIRAALAGLRR